MPETQQLTVDLEDVGGTSWWAGVLTVLTSQYGSGLYRFVGRSEGKTLYRSRTFSSPRGLGSQPPQPGWAPGLGGALDELMADLSRDGWHQVGKGKEPWSFVYERTRPNTSAKSHNG